MTVKELSNYRCPKNASHQEFTTAVEGTNTVVIDPSGNPVLNDPNKKGSEPYFSDSWRWDFDPVAKVYCYECGAEAQDAGEGDGRHKDGHDTRKGLFICPPEDGSYKPGSSFMDGET